MRPVSVTGWTTTIKQHTTTTTSAMMNHHAQYKRRIPSNHDHERGFWILSTTTAIVTMVAFTSTTRTGVTSYIIPFHELPWTCRQDQFQSPLYNNHHRRFLKRKLLHRPRCISSRGLSSYNNRNNMIDIEDIVDDPEFLDVKSNPKYKQYKLDANYDNDFDTSAFKANAVDGAQYSCVVNYDTLGNGDVTAIPYMSRFDSDSTWIVYGTNENDVVQPAGTYGQLKEDLANALKDPRVEVTVAVSVLLSCLLVAISTFENFAYRYVLLYIEDGITVVFALDFFGRWISSNKDFGRHVFNLQFAIDVVVVVIPLLFTLLPGNNIDTSSLWIPEYMTSPSALINLELLRVLRLRRVFQDMTTYTKFERALGIRNSGIQVWQLQLARVLFSLFTLLSVSTGLIYTAEHDVNPTIPNYFTALYFSISTLATLGLGDITPITWQGRLVVCGTIVAGVAIVPAQAAALVEALVSRKDVSKEQKLKSQRTLSLTTPDSTDNIVNGSSAPSHTSWNNSDGRFVLEIETTLKCPNCNATMHWSSAKFCWSCGAQL